MQNDQIKYWYEMIGDCSDVVISSRVRLARNCADLPFPNRMSENQRIALMDRVEKAIAGKVENLPLRSIRTVDLKPEFLAELAENHIVSREFCTGADKELILSDDQSAAVMVGEEDHIRIQVFRPGLDLKGCYETACKIDDVLEQSIPMAFEEELGYLTQCPTNLGTGMRASVMMHLPALEHSGALREIERNLEKLGLTIRGTYGEGSSAVGNLYQISNQITLGVTETGAMDNLESVVRQIINLERKARKKADTIETQDIVFRALGTLKYARRMDSAELQRNVSALRLGISLGYIKDISPEICNKLIAQTTPAAIINRTGKDLDSAQRDEKRAQLIREILS